MHIPFLSKKEIKAIDDLKKSYGGAQAISKGIEAKRKYEIRKKIAEQKGFGQMLNEAEGFAKKFPKIDDYKKKNNIKITKKAIATTQVSGWQGAKATHNAMKRIARDSNVLIPCEMISVMALSENYVYNGGLLATMTMCENIMGAKFCNTSMVGTPLPAKRFEHIRKVTGVRIDTVDAGNGMSSIPIINQGTAFGNLCGVEVSNDNYLVYLDSITRTALETGGNFFLNPSWSTIAAACYYGRDIPDLTFKISMLLATQDTVQLRILINIFKEYLRDDGTTPIYEINIGNAVSPDKFVECREILDSAKLSKVSTAAHIRINPDLGTKDFNWFNNALKVLDKGCNITIKYESDGECRPYDTMGAYFISEQELDEKSDVIGDVIYHKAIRCDKDAKAIMKLGYDAKFARISEE